MSLPEAFTCDSDFALHLITCRRARLVAPSSEACESEAIKTTVNSNMYSTDSMYSKSR